MKKLLISIVILFLLAGGGVVAYFGYLSPSAQAKRTANAIMQAASTQDKDAFDKYDNPKDSDSFFALAGHRNYRLESLTPDGDTFYALYRFADTGAPNSARIGLHDNRVASLTTGDKLGATPKEDPEQVADKPANNDHCLTKNDLAYLDSTSLYARTFRGATMIFADDTSTMYSGEENGKKLLDRMAHFYDKTATKDYRFTIRGYLAADKTQLHARKQIIQNRTAKLQQELVERGVSEDRIDIGEPIAYPADQPTDSQNEKYVIIDITNNCVK